jgi:hypothetical protein
VEYPSKAESACSFFAFSNASAPHGYPVHRIVGMLEQVGRFLAGEMIGELD